MAPVIPFGSDRFRLRLTLDNPLPMVGEGRSPRPFDHYLAELVRDDDERVVAFIDVYFLRLDAVGVSYMRAAVALGSEYLARVCLEAVDADGHVLEHIEDVFGDAMTDVYVFDGTKFLWLQRKEARKEAWRRYDRRRRFPARFLSPEPCRIAHIWAKILEMSDKAVEMAHVVRMFDPERACSPSTCAGGGEKPRISGRCCSLP